MSLRYGGGEGDIFVLLYFLALVIAVTIVLGVLWLSSRFGSWVFWTAFVLNLISLQGKTLVLNASNKKSRREFLANFEVPSRQELSDLLDNAIEVEEEPK